MAQCRFVGSAHAWVPPRLQVRGAGPFRAGRAPGRHLQSCPHPHPCPTWHRGLSTPRLPLSNSPLQVLEREFPGFFCNALCRHLQASSQQCRGAHSFILSRRVSCCAKPHTLGGLNHRHAFWRPEVRNPGLAGRALGACEEEGALFLPASVAAGRPCCPPGSHVALQAWPCFTPCSSCWELRPDAPRGTPWGPGPALRCCALFSP